MGWSSVGQCDRRMTTPWPGVAGGRWEGLVAWARRDDQGRRAQPPVNMSQEPSSLLIGTSKQVPLQARAAHQLRYLRKPNQYSPKLYSLIQSGIHTRFIRDTSSVVRQTELQIQAFLRLQATLHVCLFLSCVYHSGTITYWCR